MESTHPKKRNLSLDYAIHKRLKEEQARLCLLGIDRTLNEILIDMIHELDTYKSNKPE